MAFNHRILAHKDGAAWYFQIHEVYYDRAGTPISYSERASVGAESIKELICVLDRMKACANKPILSADDFPNEWVGD